MSGYKSNFAFSLLRRIYWAQWISRPLTSYHRGLNLASLEFDVQVDGYPRSANSYASHFVELSQSGRIRVRRHHHLPSSVIHSVRNGKPVLLLLRHPRDCATSHAIYMASSLSEQVRFYRDYHRALRSYARGVCVALFDDVTRDMAGVLQAFDRQFGLELRHDYDLNHIKRQAEESVRQQGWSRDRDNQVNFRRISLPSDRREELKQAMQAELERIERGRLFAKALAEFEHFARIAVRPGNGKTNGPHGLSPVLKDANGDPG